MKKICFTKKAISFVICYLRKLICNCVTNSYKPCDQQCGSYKFKSFKVCFSQMTTEFSLQIIQKILKKLPQ